MHGRADRAGGGEAVEPGRVVAHVPEREGRALGAADAGVDQDGVVRAAVGPCRDERLSAVELARDEPEDGGRTKLVAYCER